MRRVLVICAHAMTLAAFLCPANAQTFGRNPTVNADAEAGPADANGSAPVSTIPGWNRSGSIDVLTYASGYRLNLTTGQVLPPDHGSNYFSGGPPASLSQTIDLSPAASSIDTGSVTCALSAYLGGLSSDSGTAAITVRFTGASGNALGTLQAGPATSSERSGNTCYNNACGTAGVTNPGKNFFYGGPSNPQSIAYQECDVSPAAGLIDQGQVNFTLSAWLGGFEAQQDSAVLTIEFRSWSNNVIGNTVQLGPVTNADRQNFTQMLFRSTNGVVPTGTRYIAVQLV